MNEPPNSTSRELPAHADVRAFLARWPASVPDDAARTRLLTALIAERTVMQSSRIAAPRSRWIGAVWLGRAQVRTIQPLLWLASALVMALGTFLTVIIQPMEGAVVLPLTIIAPIVAAFGIAFLYGLDTDPAIELVMATPVSPRTIMLARLALVFGFNLFLSTLLSILLASIAPTLSFTALVLDWFAPMTFLSALAFLLSVLTYQPTASALISLCLWMLLVVRNYDSVWGEDLLSFVPDILRSGVHLPMLIAGVAIILIALWRIDHEERWAL